MDWQNIEDRKPKNNQVVLASINGVYKITRFDELHNCLIEVTTAQSYFLNSEGLSVYWSEIETPTL
jgi:hypothetical protein